MKQKLIVALLLLMSNVMMAQIKLAVEVRTPHSEPSRNVRVWLKESITGQVIENRTNAEGKITFDIPQGTWSISLKGLPDYKEYQIPPGQSGTANLLVTYDEKEMLEEAAIIEQRRTATFTEVNQTYQKYTSLPEGYTWAKVKVINSQQIGQKNVVIRMVSVKQQKVYFIDASSRVGVVQFEVPANERYAIDVEDVKNCSFTPVLRAGSAYTFNVLYDKTNVVEKDVKDTITQTILMPAKPSSARSLSTIYVYNESRQPAVNEWIYLSNIYSKKVYKAKTDNEGKAQFLLPNGDKYMVHFTFQKDVDVLNLSKVQGQRNSTNRFIYRPDPRLQYPEKYIPTPDNLYLEEFQTFYKKQIEPPTQGLVGLGLKWLGEVVTPQSREAVLQIGFTIKNDSSIAKLSPPMHLMFVLDRSGSMEGYDRMGALKKVMGNFSAFIRPIDKIGIISFDEFYRIDLPLQSRTSQSEYHKALSDIEAGGGTHIGTAMVMGYKMLEAQYDKKCVNKLLLLTDGYGDDEPKTLVDSSKMFNKKDLGISTIGVGEGYNAALLNLLASEGGGMMAQVKDAATLQDAFNEQISAMIVPMGMDAELNIYYNQKISYSQLFGYTVNSSDKDRVNIKIGKLYGGQNKICLAQFNLRQLNEEIEKEPIKIELSYTNAQTQKRDTIIEFANLKWDNATGQAKLEIDQDIKKLYAIAIMNQSIKIMVEAFAENDYSKARTTIDRALEQMKEFYPNASDTDVIRLINQLKLYAKGVALVIKK